MTLKIKKIILLLLFTLLIFFSIVNTNIVISSVITSANVFFYKVFPSLFPFFVLIDFLINYGISDKLNIIFNNFFSKIFKINSSGAFVVILSMLSGLPSNAKMIKELIDSGELSTEEAAKLLTFTFFPNPMFVIGTVGTIIFNNTFLGIKMLLIIYLTNLIIGLLIRGKYSSNMNYNFTQHKQENFSVVLKKSINKSFDSLVLILGSITIFMTLSNLFSVFSPFNDSINAVITSVFEMTSGVTKISELLISDKIKIMLTNASLTFTGLCIISQATSILSGYNIDFKFVIKYRFLAVILNLILTFVLM